MKGRYPPPFSFSRKKKRKGGRSPRQEPPFGRLRGETRLRPQGRCKTKKRLWCRPMGPVLLSKHFNARQLHCRFGARRTPPSVSNRCRWCWAKEQVRCCFLQHRKSGSGKRGALRLPCTKLGTVLCAILFGNDSAVSESLIQGPIFLLHPGALFFFRPSKKEEGAVSFPKK